MRQHTDSHSTGLIDVNDREVTDARSNPPRFLEDVEKGKLHYYSPTSIRRPRASRKGKIRRSFPRSGFSRKRFSTSWRLPPKIAEDSGVIEEFQREAGSENGLRARFDRKERQEVIPARGEPE